jgi:hypothetical protein
MFFLLPILTVIDVDITIIHHIFHRGPSFRLFLSYDTSIELFWNLELNSRQNGSEQIANNFDLLCSQIKE